jgi:transketolase
LGELTEALSRPLADDRPGVVIANTIKGKGVSFMEEVGRWHHGVPNDEEYAKALAEIDAAIAGIGHPAGEVLAAKIADPGGAR